MRSKLIIRKGGSTTRKPTLAQKKKTKAVGGAGKRERKKVQIRSGGSVINEPKQTKQLKEKVDE